MTSMANDSDNLFDVTPPAILRKAIPPICTFCSQCNCILPRNRKAILLDASSPISEKGADKFYFCNSECYDKNEESVNYHIS